MSLLGSLADPCRCLGNILGNPPTFDIHNSKIYLCLGITLLGSLAVPAHGLGIIFGNPVAVGIHNTKIFLCLCKSLFGSLAVPVHGLCIIFSNPHASVILEANNELCVGISLLGNSFHGPQSIIFICRVRRMRKQNQADKQEFEHGRIISRSAISGD